VEAHWTLQAAANGVSCVWWVVAMHGDGDRWAQVSLRSGCDPWTSTAGLHASKGRVWAGTGVESAETQCASSR
jgi:hypothetical protein